MDTTIIAKRLKKLRVENGYSHDKLEAALEKKYGYGITSASLKKYEVDNPENKLNGKVIGMRIEFLYMLADFYNVPTDYILGRTNSTSVDVTEQTIYENFGLNGGALTNLKILNKTKEKVIEEQYFGVPLMLALNSMLTGNLVNAFLTHVFKHYIEKEKYLQDYSNRYGANSKTKKRLENSFRDVNRYFAINTIETFIDDFYDRFTEYRQAQNIKK